MAKTKKRQKRDFQKVKLKVGRKLKPANETLPLVKVGHIQIRQQFSADTKAPGAKKEAKVKDLLKLCENSKTLVRYDGIQQLRLCLTAQPVTTHFPNYFYRVLAVIPTLFIDEDMGVRSEARRLLSWIFSSNEFEQIFDPGDPDLNLLLPYLRLAMNHSQEDVKVDSLALLDIYVTSRRLILFGTVSILKDLLVLIAAQRRSQLDKVRSQSSGGGASRGKSWSLATNPESKLSQQKWRASVLERLGKFFQVLYDEICIESNLQCEVTEYGSYVDIKSVLCDSTVSRLLTENLIPLLFECWIETGFQKSGSEQVLDHVSICILQTTLKVMGCLISIMTKLETVRGKNESAFLMTFEKYCIQHFSSGFPFKINQKGSKKDTATKDVSVSFNVSVCYILLHFIGTRGNQLTDDVIQQMTAYILTVLDMPHHVLSADVREVVFKLVNYFADSDSDGLCEKLVTACIGVVSGHPPKSEQQRSWFNLVSDLLITSAVDNPQQWAILVKFSSVQMWLRSLPDLFLTMGRAGHRDSPKVNELIYELIVLRQDVVRECFTKNLNLYLDESFLKPFANIAMTGALYSNTLSRFLDTVRIASKVEVSSLQLLMRSALNGMIPPKEFAYFCDNIAISFSRPLDNQLMASVDFLEFRNILMNAVMAGFKVDIEALSERNRSATASPRWVYVCCDPFTSASLLERWKRQRELVQNAIRTIGLLPDCMERLKEVLGFIKSALETYRNLGILNACSLALAVCCCPDIASPIGPSHNEIGEFLRQLVSELLLGLIQCTDIKMSDKTLDEYAENQPPVEVVVYLLQLYSVIFDEVIIQTRHLIKDQTCSHDELRKLISFLAILKRDKHMNPVTQETIEQLVQKFNSDRKSYSCDSVQTHQTNL